MNGVIWAPAPPTVTWKQCQRCEDLDNRWGTECRNEMVWSWRLFPARLWIQPINTGTVIEFAAMCSDKGFTKNIFPVSAGKWRGAAIWILTKHCRILARVEETEEATSHRGMRKVYWSMFLRNCEWWMVSSRGLKFKYMIQYEYKILAAGCPGGFFKVVGKGWILRRWDELNRLGKTGMGNGSFYKY